MNSPAYKSKKPKKDGAYISAQLKCGKFGLAFVNKNQAKKKYNYEGC